MNPNIVDTIQNQILRGKVLMICAEAEPLGAGTEVIAAALRKEGYAVNTADVDKICKYLEQKNLIDIDTIENKVLDLRRDIAHITPCGIDFLEGTTVVQGVELE